MPGQLKLRDGTAVATSLGVIPMRGQDTRDISTGRQVTDTSYMHHFSVVKGRSIKETLLGDILFYLIFISMLQDFSDLIHS